MQISMRSEYGLRAMLDLAEHRHLAPVSLRSVAKRQEISEFYLQQLIAVLKKAGLVRSIRGAQGGYELARQPEQIKISEIFTVLEGEIAPAECARKSLSSKECKNSPICSVRLLWQRIGERIWEVLNTTTLADLIVQSEKLIEENDKENTMYHI